MEIEYMEEFCNVMKPISVTLDCLQTNIFKRE